MPEYIPPDARDFDVDLDFDALATQDPAWVIPIVQAVRKSITRREFIKRVIASGATVTAAGYLFRSTGISSARAASPGTAERLISLKVNARIRCVDVPPQETLAMTLRYKLGLTGTKLGCGRGECGACRID